MTDDPPALSSPRRGRGRGCLHIGASGALLVLAVLVAVYLEENWRGARHYAQVSRALEARGEVLRWRSFIPPAVADDQNLAMAPLFAREFQYRADPKTGTYTFGRTTGLFQNLRGMPFGPNNSKPAKGHLSGWERAEHTNLAAFAEDYRKKKEFPQSPQPQGPAADVLLALTKYQPFLDEFASAASERPFTRFPVDWYKAVPVAAPMPHLFMPQQILSTLALRASARLAAGQNGEALGDVLLSLRLIRDVAAEPLLIAQMVNHVGISLTLAPVWEGLADRRWTAADLARLQGELTRLDVLASALQGSRSERASSLLMLDVLKHEARALANAFAPDEPAARGVGTALLWLSPPGWIDQNKALLAEWNQEAFIDVINLKERRVYPDKTAAAVQRINAMPNRPSTVLVKLASVIPSGLVRRAARTQTALDQAAVACGLERFRLDHGNYPSVLGELPPSYLERVPRDLMSGAEIHYRQTPDGRYQLRSLGWDDRDDDGKVAWTEKGSLDLEKGDWVWQYSPVEPPSPVPRSRKRQAVRPGNSCARAGTAFPSHAECSTHDHTRKTRPRHRRGRPDRFPRR